MYVYINEGRMNIPKEKEEDVVSFSLMYNTRLEIAKDDISGLEKEMSKKTRANSNLPLAIGKKRR